MAGEKDELLPDIPGVWSEDPEAYPTPTRGLPASSSTEESPPRSPLNIGSPLAPIPETRAAPTRPQIDTIMTNGFNEKSQPLNGSTTPVPGIRKTSTTLSAMTKDSFDLEMDPLPYRDAGITEIQVRPKKLVLFFDGTGNKFKGNTSVCSTTNAIRKSYPRGHVNMFSRAIVDQVADEGFRIPILSRCKKDILY